MGVDIQTYRAKIGTYKHSHGVNVITQVVVVNFSHGLKTVGSVLFIGILLIMAGVEQNPGPRESDFFVFSVAMAFALTIFGVILRVTGFANLQLKDICFLAILIVAILIMNHLYYQTENVDDHTSAKEAVTKAKTVQHAQRSAAENLRYANTTSDRDIGKSDTGHQRTQRTNTPASQQVQELDANNEKVKATSVQPAKPSDAETAPSDYTTSDRDIGTADTVHQSTQRFNTSQQQLDANNEKVNKAISVQHAQRSDAEIALSDNTTSDRDMGTADTGHKRTQRTNTPTSQQQLDENNEKGDRDMGTVDTGHQRTQRTNTPTSQQQLVANKEKVNKATSVQPVKRLDAETATYDNTASDHEMGTADTGHRRTQRTNIPTIQKELDAHNEKVNKASSVQPSKRLDAETTPSDFTTTDRNIGTADTGHQSTQRSNTPTSQQQLDANNEKVNKTTSVQLAKRFDAETALSDYATNDHDMGTADTGHQSTKRTNTPTSQQQQLDDNSEKVKKATTVQPAKQSDAETALSDNTTSDREMATGHQRTQTTNTPTLQQEMDASNKKEHGDIEKPKSELRSTSEFSSQKTITGQDGSIENTFLIVQDSHNETTKQETRPKTEVSLQKQERSLDNSASNTTTIPKEPKETQAEIFSQILLKLGLASKYPGKISIQEVITVDPIEAANQDKEYVSLVDLPWMILKKLICAQSDSRDMTVSIESYKENNMELDNTESFISDVYEENQDISPLDLFAVLFQCCDPLMKQIFVQKLFLCKIAVPFLCKYWEREESLQSVISVWPLRSLAIENRSQSDNCQWKSKEVDLLELQTKVLAFARIGRPRYSKSKLLNSLLSSQICNTFYNIDCPSGMAHRSLSIGHIEMFWLPTTGDKKDRFHDAMTFLNMRGDLKENFSIDILSFINEFVDAVTIIIDRESIVNNAKYTKSILLNFSSVVLVFADPLRPDTVKAIHRFESEVIASKPCINLRVLSTHKGVYEQNVVDMVSSISKHITSHLKSSYTKSFQERLNDARLVAVETDEQEKNCQQARNEAEKIIKQMKHDGKPLRWKHLLTPVHSTHLKELGNLVKKRARDEDGKAGENVNQEIKNIRRIQTQSITKTVKVFIDILLRNRDSHMKLKIFLCWLHFHIEREKRTILPELMYKNRCAWEKLKTLKSKETKDSSEIENQEAEITQSEKQIDEASFSVEHFFREIGHIYEAILELKETPSKFKLPSLKEIANVIGKLVADGHQLELVDGESFLMPYSWTKTVLEQVGHFIDTSKVMTLSVLGLQSSGKSTLLNTMFGSQFSTRTGRCTRGIHLQLIPLKTTLSYEDILSPFNYVLLVDTEGLRSPDLSHLRHEHDNELATVITGIGDVTMLNIMGENTSEIRDILQVIVHAFLRLKMTNKNLDIRKSCAFIHQNVADTSASENMISGLSKLIQTLDEMTKESARSEGIHQISTFNQVIEFDINSHVWYLKNLWQGNPPMARVNNEYSEKVVDLKCKVLQKALQLRNKTYKSLSDIIQNAHDLWKGVLNEDFVFSFRNSLEISAYMEMERVVQDELWRLECSIRDTLVEITQTKFAGCDQKDDLQYIAEKLIDDLKDTLANKRSDREKAIETYFEKSKYKDIIIQWKKSQYIRIDILCHKLDQIIRQQIEKSVVKRSVEIFTIANHEKHEEELSRRSMDVANQYKGVKLTERQMNDLFNTIWQSFVTKVDTTSYSSEKHRKNMKQLFINWLEHKFNENNALLKDNLKRTSQLEPIPNLNKLKGSFPDTGIDDSDIEFTFWQRGKQFVHWSKAMKHVSERVNQIYEAVDEKININCKVNDEITEMAVNKLMHDLDASIHGILTENTKYTFQKVFYVKIYVHVSRYAHHVFEMHNDNFFKTQGTAVRLAQYKEQQKISFESHLSNRQSEDIAARLFSHVIEIFAEEWTSQNISNKVTDELHSALPCIKNRLIIEICTDLVDTGNFKQFLRYARAPHEYASLWISRKANSHLFDDETRAYSSLANSLLNTVFRNVEDSVRKLKYSYRRSTTSMDRWLNDFQKSLNSKLFSIQPESFRNVKKEVEEIKNVEYLTDEILANLLVSKGTITAKFNRHNSMSVTWANTNPIDLIIKKIWGCSEQCVFCGEPCAKNADHDGSVHYSIQHRPECCRGTYYTDSNEASLHSCNFNVHSHRTHTCGVFNYTCNSRTRNVCGKEHYYREYKTYIPDWDIPPTSYMHDTSKFWMWFVATYKNDLQRVYNYKVDNIPSSWDDITKDEAKDSLLKTYSV